jgi:hypothetical protein
MNIKASYNYQMADQKKSISIYYFIIVCILIALFVLTSVTINSGSVVNANFNGLDLATVIFLFVCGLCGFKECFLMLAQNGVSRKTLFVSRLLTTVSIAFVMAVIDKILFIVFKELFLWQSETPYTSLYELIYPAKAAEMNVLNLHTASFIFDFCLYLCIMAAGYLITILFYRLNNAGKVAVGAGVPVGFFIVLPIIDRIAANGKIGTAIFKFIDFSFGFSEGIPVHAYITCIISFAVLSILSWMLIRKAAVK